MNIPANHITRAIGKQLLKAKSNSPTIFFVGGVACVVGGTVLACRSTLKLHETVDSIQEDLETAKAVQMQNAGASATIVKQSNRDVARVYANGAYQIGKLYAPAVILTSAGLAALTGSHVILTRRNAAVTAAYAAVAKSYEDYRGRVREEVGEEKELTLYRAVEWVEVEGSEGAVEEPVTSAGKWGNPYSRFFDSTNPNWKNNRDLNLFFLECQERWFNHVFTQRGHVFLNEVYQNLGIPHSKEGQVVGWVYNNDADEADNYIDFGVYEAHDASKIPDNRQKDIVLDFNVDGYILDKIKG